MNLFGPLYLFTDANIATKKITQQTYSHFLLFRIYFVDINQDKTRQNKVYTKNMHQKCNSITDIRYQNETRTKYYCKHK